MRRLQAVERPARQRAGIEVAGRECHRVDAHRIGGIGLFRGNRPAARPLVAGLGAAEGDCADRSVARHDARPHVVVEAAVAGPAGRLDACLQRRRQLVPGDRAVRRLGAAGGAAQISAAPRKTRFKLADRIRRLPSKQWLSRAGRAGIEKARRAGLEESRAGTPL